MDSTNNQRQQLIEKVRSAKNVLVTVSSNPTVDQMVACVGLTLLLNKVKKHATAVFSGEIPSTIEFLKPEETIEKNTDSLRDFIIALDRSKADKLRYKLEDNIVKIFITPYRTSVSQEDLEFSQGDFNVDLVIALGVKNQEELDQAVAAHGRILHDAAVATINLGPDSKLGSINWHDASSSSLSELVADLGANLGKDPLDAQIATALLTGIVAETERFSNEKTSSRTMTISAQLMAAGANQQLVATKLEEKSRVEESPAQQGPRENRLEEKAEEKAGDKSPEATSSDDGMLEIEHSRKPAEPSVELPEPAEAKPEGGLLSDTAEPEQLDNKPDDKSSASSGRMIFEPPTLGGTLTANSHLQSGIEPVTDPLSLPKEESPILNHDKPKEKAKTVEPPVESLTELPKEEPKSEAKEEPEPLALPPKLEPSADQIQIDEAGQLHLVGEPKETDVSEPAAPEQSGAPGLKGAETLADIEKGLGSPHLDGQKALEQAAQEEVEKALNAVPPAPKREERMGATPLGPASLHEDEQPLPPEAETPPPLRLESMGNEPAPLQSSPADQSLPFPMPPGLPSVPPVSPSASAPPVPPSGPAVDNPNAPPAVPPPFMPENFELPPNESHPDSSNP